jgi:signal transduction histidine kinase
VPFSVRRYTVWIAIALAVAIVVVAVVHHVHFAYESVDFHVMVATSVALIGILAAGLVLARFLRSSRLQDLALTCALVILSGTNLFLSAVPLAFGEVNSHYDGWAPFLGRLVGALFFALSVAVPDMAVRNTRRAAWWTGLGSIALVGLIAIVAAWLSPGWADPMRDAIAPAGSDSPYLTSDTIQLVVLGVCFGLYVVAALGFVSRAERTGDELFGWFALAAPFGAAAAASYFLFPSLYPGWIYTADLFRLGFYMMLALGAAREIAAWHEELAEAAASGERRRIARDLHDGLAQELAFIVGQTRSLEGQTGGEGPFAHIAAAAERALDESRTAIAALSRTVDETLDVALAQAAEDVAGRTGTHIRLELEPGIRVPHDTREDLARIVREAVSNAARHGRASNVLVTLSNTGSIRVRVVDDGEGFDPDAPRRRGFGLTSMRERAEVRGGVLTLTSEPGKGTEVEVILP